jgi:hypothetical protein
LKNKLNLKFTRSMGIYLMPKNIKKCIIDFLG